MAGRESFSAAAERMLKSDGEGDKRLMLSKLQRWRPRSIIEVLATAVGHWVVTKPPSSA